MSKCILNNLINVDFVYILVAVWAEMAKMSSNFQEYLNKLYDKDAKLTQNHVPMMVFDSNFEK